MSLTVGSLFTGIGGLDLGLERAGMRVIWQSEIDPYCCRVLAKHWPDIPNLGDITEVDWSSVERPDVICGGYPCQPFSLAGRRKGEDDTRHLWPRLADALRVLRPDYALMENVTGHLALGFGDVLADLAESGYDTEWSVVSACAVGAPHTRERVFILAYANEQRFDTSRASRNRDGQTSASRRTDTQHLCPVAFTGELTRRSHWTAEPDMGRMADGVPHGMDRLRALGNAVVPQVAEHIGRLLLEVAA